MLKSHLRIHPTEPTEEEEGQSHVPESQGNPEPSLTELRAAEEQEKYDYIELVVEPPRDVRYLNKSEVSIRLSFLGKTADGDGYTYLKASLTEMGLTHIDAITSFKHLQFLDVSMNSIRTEELQVVTKLPYLILLHADKNLLTSARLHRMNYLQVIIMNNNELTTVHDVFQPELTTLEVGFNKIQKIDFENRMPTLKCLDFRNNMLVELPDMDFPNLDSLYLANNKIVSLIGIEKLVNLRILHVRNNPIKILDGFHEDLRKLVYINLRNCKIWTLRQVKKLRVLKNLETLIVKGCPYMGGTGFEDPAAGPDEEDNAETRIEILASLPLLKRINKVPVTPEEREEAKNLIIQWAEEGEKDEEEIEDEMLMENHDEDDGQ